MLRMRVSVLRSLMLAVLGAGLALSSTFAAADAAATYKGKCAMCHGADGKGATPAGKSMGAHDFASPDVQKESDADLATVITKGKGKMPAYENKLKAAEITDLVSYIRQLGK